MRARHAHLASTVSATVDLLETALATPAGQGQPVLSVRPVFTDPRAQRASRVSTAFATQAWLETVHAAPVGVGSTAPNV